MKIILQKKDLLKLIKDQKNLGFVPTMGALHLGHISLIKKSIRLCNKTIVTIFINRPQFNRKNDYNKYPRLLNKDIKILKKLKIDFLYLPKHNDIYPVGISKNLKIHSLSKKLCGKFRPKHFNAVVDVVERFIKIINPRKIFFGEKDMQQLKIIEDYVNKNYKKIKVISCKTIREKNGIAYSSRNFLLSKKEKSIASKVYKYLLKNKIKLINNKFFLKIIKKNILKFGVNKIDYIESIDVNKLIKPHKKKIKHKIFIAYYLRKIRLIDNI